MGIRAGIAGLGALVASLLLGLQAHAAVVEFSLNGAGFSANGFLTVTPDVSPKDPDSSCGTVGNNPCRADPAGAYAITSITGTFSDAADGISNAKITGLVPINPAPERDTTFDGLVPTSLSFIDYAPPSGYFTYNNLYFPNGSPIDCDFPNSGTFLDVFGMAFTIAGHTVDVWGDGDLFGPGTTTYGIGVTDGKQQLADVFAGVNGSAVGVPEPATWALMLTGFGGLGAVLRRRRPVAGATA